MSPALLQTQKRRKLVAFLPAQTELRRNRPPNTQRLDLLTSFFSHFAWQFFPPFHSPFKPQKRIPVNVVHFAAAVGALYGFQGNTPFLPAIAQSHKQSAQKRVGPVKGNCAFRFHFRKPLLLCLLLAGPSLYYFPDCFRYQRWRVCLALCGRRGPIAGSA